MLKATQHDDMPIGVDTWGDKDMAGAYKPGTTMDMGDGKSIRMDELPDYIGGKVKGRPPVKRVVPRAPARDGS